MRNLVIVESPAKAKTIAKYLGKDYSVIASFGHIRELPSKDGSVEPDKDFAMHYQVSSKSTKHVSEIAKLAKNSDKIILAPDPDREGESIAWHIVEVLKQKKIINDKTLIERVVFNAITKNSVIEAIKKPRKIDEDLVNAQQARRALDYLVGFNLSPILWRKLPGSRSAGRVQSVSLRLICDREDEIQSFISQEYWDIKLSLGVDKNFDDIFEATIVELEGVKLDKFSIINQDSALKILSQLEGKSYQVSSVVKKQTKRRSYPPFTTSSLQQEASRKLGFSASKTMMIAQKLYEGIEIEGSSQGLITYMRTDSIAIVGEALTESRDAIKNIYGDKYLSETVNIFKSKVKNAQEAHEAIRPTDFNLPPDKVSRFLEKDYFSLYDLIWKRTLASQMSDVIFDQVAVEIITLPDYAKARAVGSVIKFEGFYKIYREDYDEKAEDDEYSRKLPELAVSQNLYLESVKPNQHFTEPPPRYGEASLVKKMEELGIGRPSTYATIISVLQDRGYVVLDKKRFFPQELGRIVTLFLKEFFPVYVAFDYTADLEDQLDEVSNGTMNWKQFLHKFWVNFYENINQVSAKSFSEVIDVLSGKIIKQIFGLDTEGSLQNQCPSCEKGKLFLKLGKYGAFLGCSNYPDCKHIRQIFKENIDGNSGEDAKKSTFEPRSLGIDPKTSCEILVKIGPYGAYLELAGSEMKSTTEELKQDLKKSTKTKNSKPKVLKPKRVSLPKNLDPATIEVDSAIKLLSLPRELGIHPETEQKIIANIGPYGPYISHNGKFISVKEDDILEIGLNRAVDLIFNHSSKENSKTPSAVRFSKFKQASKSTVKKAVTKKSPSKTSKTTVKKTKK